MEGLVESEGAGAGAGAGGVCACRSGGSLAVLADVQKAYEERMEVIEKVGGSKKLQLQVEALRSWVGDLVGQNTLLARTVHELEQEATARLVLERTRHSEKELELRAEAAALRRRLARKESDLRGLVEVLRRLREFDYCTLEGIHFFEVTESDIFGTMQWRQKKLEQGDIPPVECGGKEGKMSKAASREIRRLNKDVQKYEQTILNIRSEMLNFRNMECPKKDAEVMVGMSCTQECGADLGDVGYGVLLKDETIKDRLRKMEHKVKDSGDQVRALRKVNVTLSEELHALRRVCAALDEQCRAVTTRTAFKDDIIREMRRQLKQAKAKLKASESADTNEYAEKLRGSSVSRSCDSVACTQPRRLRHSASHACDHDQDRNIPTSLHTDIDSPRFECSGNGSGDDCGLFKAD